MQTRRRRKALTVVGAILALLIALAVAAPTARGARVTLHVGSHGVRVKNLQWLLTGNPPSRYPTVHPLLGRKPNGSYGKRTATAVAAAKWRIGYPAASVNKTAGPLLFRILLGQQKRPLAWIGTAAKRQATLLQDLHEAKVSACQRRVVEVARSQLGVREVPFGSNWGPQIVNYQAVTGAYHAAWCASFAQWTLLHAGYGTFGDRSAGVFYIRGWAYQRGLLRAIARPGVLVLFLESQGHMGIVERVVQGGFYSIEGNRGNEVARAYHPFSRSTVFVYLPHCSEAPVLRNPDGGVFAGLFDGQSGGVVAGCLLALVCWLCPPPHKLIRKRRRRKKGA